MTKDSNESAPAVPPFPPPPPPIPSFLQVNNLGHSNSQINASFKSSTSTSHIQELDESIRKIQAFEGISNILPSFIQYIHLEPLLQDGPMCGLVALSMASSVTKNPISIDRLFSIALTNRYTKQGEMFSVESIAALAKNSTDFSTKIIHGGLDAHLSCIVHGLSRGSLLLVPYDADYNHSPCCKKGHKAHWAIISGVIIFEAEDEGNELVKSSNNNYNYLSSSSCSCLVDTTSENLVNIQQSSGRNKIYTVARQGKSKHLGLWRFDQLAESNNNLTSISPDRDNESYIVPDGGLEQGLKGKAVLLQTDNVQISKISTIDFKVHMSLKEK